MADCRNLLAFACYVDDLEADGFLDGTLLSSSS